MAAENWPIIGQHEAIDFLEKLLEFERRAPGRIGGSYIFKGPSLVGKTAALEHFLSRLFSVDNSEASESFWPDVVRLSRLEDKREIGVAQTRTFIAQLALSSFTDRYRIGIIEGAHALSLESANALLKTLEEARGRLMVFLITSSAEQLPATVVSRSQLIRFRPVAADTIYEWLISEHSVARPQAKNLTRLSGGLPGLASRLAGDKALLERYLAPARLLLALLGGRLYEQWKEVGKLLGSAKGAEAARTAGDILTGWRLAIRDVMFVHLNQPELIRHAFLEQEIRAASQRLSLSDARRIDSELERSADYLRSNVNPKLVLEQAIMNTN